jgi:hypothetical protein
MTGPISLADTRIHDVIDFLRQNSLRIFQKRTIRNSLFYLIVPIQKAMTNAAGISYCSQTAAEITTINIRRAELALANARELILTRHAEIGILSNSVRESELSLEIDSCQSRYTQIYADEERRLRDSTRASIRDLENESELRRERILRELEGAHRRYRMAREAADASRAILAVPVDDAGGDVTRRVTQKKMDALRAAVENMRSKRPAWQKIAEELRVVQAKANRSSPRRSPGMTPPNFGFTLQTIEQQSKKM